MSDEFERGQAFGAYVLEARLGGGGFGTVWRARESSTGELVALKILAGKFSAGETGRLRADVELLAAAASSGSKHVVRVLGGGPDPVPHVVMEYIEGVNLEEELHRLGTMPQHEALRVIRGVAEALAVLQQAGIIHRDVKPANVMLTRDGTVKLTDFGIAKIAGYESVTATGQLPLTGAYAAPEVWGGEATYQSDYYALGAMVFELLTGARPFNGNFVQLYEMHRNRDPDYALLPGEIVPALRRLIVECLQKERVRRPADPSVLLALTDEAEAQISTRQGEAPAAATHEPRALGPWLIESVHPKQPWAFKCLHETSGERATVEVHFSDSLELGESLKRAVGANPQLVPLGAERLLGTNRLILRPGEAWPEQPKEQFMFWVARQELPAPIAPATVDDISAEKYATAALQLVTTSVTAGPVFNLRPDSAVLGRDGEVYATRVGLPGDGGTTVVEWLREVLPAKTLFDGLSDDAALAGFLAERERSRQVAAPGMARIAATAPTTEIVDESALLDRNQLGSLPQAPAEPVPERQQVSAAPERPAPIGSPPGPRSPRKWFGWGAGGVVIAALIAAGVIFVFGGGDGPKVGCDGDACETPTPTAIATATATASATALPPPTPSTTSSPAGATFSLTPVPTSPTATQSTPTRTSTPTIIPTPEIIPTPNPTATASVQPTPLPTPTSFSGTTEPYVVSVSARTSVSTQNGRQVETVYFVAEFVDPKHLARVAEGWCDPPISTCQPASSPSSYLLQGAQSILSAGFGFECGQSPYEGIAWVRVRSAQGSSPAMSVPVQCRGLTELGFR